MEQDTKVEVAPRVAGGVGAAGCWRRKLSCALQVAATFKQKSEVCRRSWVAAFDAPPPGVLRAVEVADLVQQDPKVESCVGVASLLSPLVSCDRAREVPARVEQDTKIESTSGVAGAVRATVRKLGGLFARGRCTGGLRDGGLRHEGGPGGGRLLAVPIGCGRLRPPGFRCDVRRSATGAGDRGHGGHEE
jgi:hypothetical protein